MKKSTCLVFIFVQLLSFYLKFTYAATSQNNIDFCESLTLKPICVPLLKYRPINGRCNNLKNPFSGASNTKLSRLLPTRYFNGIATPPKSVTGAELPSARLISLNVFDDKNVSHPELTIALMQFTQLIAHDVSNILRAPKVNGCCNENGQLDAVKDQSCFYIPVPPNDAVHPGHKCLNFRRSETDYGMKCPKFRRGRPSEQINGATATFDLSNIYGSTQEKLNSIRSFKNGQLKVETRNNMDWPPRYSVNDGKCILDTPQDPCYLSGDPNINQNPGIAIIDILFIREHNRIARELKKLNPKWTEEILFQESRRINIAQYQNILFYQWLFTGVGERGIKSFGFKYIPSGGEYANRYNPSNVPTLFNEFTAGVFRFPHTLIEGHLKKISISQTLEEVIRLSDTFNRPKFIEANNSFSNFLRGMIIQPAQAFDPNYDEEIRSFLLRNNKTFGNDLKALDIQRGRDHGLGSYNDLRVFSGLKRATKWEDFLDHISQADVDKMKSVYADVKDVDLGVGSSLEKGFVPGVIFGITYFYVIKAQLTSIVTGDRYWYENGDQVFRFTSEQLTELRKASIARIMCDNGGITAVQKNPFRLPDDADNKLVDCTEIPNVNLAVFKVK